MDGSAFGRMFGCLPWLILGLSGLCLVLAGVALAGVAPMTPPRSPGPARDHGAARKFAVQWSTSSDGKIANLSGCYLRAMGDLGTLQRIARDVVAHWDEIHGTTPDPEGLWRGIEELRELTKEPA